MRQITLVSLGGDDDLSVVNAIPSSGAPLAAGMTAALHWGRLEPHQLSAPLTK